ncbi:hypothetical protein BC343_25895 [Mucilaginibacter pedocola]|uniref:Uncharacterized protein n=1 Tax=Mucilaginibacter pedocola TaxID=1792845 RepID=A0A1S9PGW4_9SPHI|nr:hypothetical protein BC343_25895 [Mucilaginibacter pedocola]
MIQGAENIFISRKPALGIEVETPEPREGRCEGKGEELQRIARPKGTPTTLKDLTTFKKLSNLHGCIPAFFPYF